MLFIYNHDAGYDRRFEDILKNIRLEGIDIPRDRRIFVLGPMEIKWLHNVSYDVQWLRGKSGAGKLPAAEACSYFYPQGDRGIRLRGSESCAAILEVLTGPWVILRYHDDKNRLSGYIVYYRDTDASVDDFLYFIDYMRRYGMLTESDCIRIRYVAGDGGMIASSFQSAQQQYADLVAKSLTDSDSLAAIVKNIAIEPISNVIAKFSDMEIGMEYARQS